MAWATSVRRWRKERGRVKEAGGREVVGEYWLTRWGTTPDATSSATAMCAYVGIAWVIRTDLGGALPCAFRVHTPSGPRNEAIPAEQEIPAPVKKYPLRDDA